MRGARHRVFHVVHVGHEHTRNAIIRLPPGSDRNAQARQRGQPMTFRPHRPHLGFRLDHQEQIPVQKRGFRPCSHGPRHGFRDRDFRERAGRGIKRDRRVPDAGRHGPRGTFKTEAAALGGRQPGEDKGRGHRRMPAKINFPVRGEPAQPPGIAVAHRKRRFRESVLAGDGLHERFRWPGPGQADGRRIAAEKPVGEDIDDILRERHGRLRKAMTHGGDAA